MKFKRNDITFPLNKDGVRDGGMFGRVWRRIDENHVQVIESGKHVRIYNEKDIDLANEYKGYVDLKTGRLIRMTSLRKLKKNARDYNAHFGGCNFLGRKHTKEEQQRALNDREVFVNSY
jgi:hypothetical protein